MLTEQNNSLPDWLKTEFDPNEIYVVDEDRDVLQRFINWINGKNRSVNANMILFIEAIQNAASIIQKNHSADETSKILYKILICGGISTYSTFDSFVGSIRKWRGTRLPFMIQKLYQYVNKNFSQGDDNRLNIIKSIESTIQQLTSLEMELFQN